MTLCNALIFCPCAGTRYFAPVLGYRDQFGHGTARALCAPRVSRCRSPLHLSPPPFTSLARRCRRGRAGRACLHRPLALLLPAPLPRRRARQSHRACAVPGRAMPARAPASPGPTGRCASSLHRRFASPPARTPPPWPPPPRPPRTAHLRPSPAAPSTSQGSSWLPLASPPPNPRRRRASSPDFGLEPPPTVLGASRKNRSNSRGFFAKSVTYLNSS